MEQNKTTKKTASFGKEMWILPFRAGGFWVSDAKDRSVCECRSYELAKAMADLLNKTANAA